MDLRNVRSPAPERVRSGEPASAGPNNFGPTLLISLGLMSALIGLGIPLILLGLARLRTSQGAPAFPILAASLQTAHLQLQAWSVR